MPRLLAAAGPEVAAAVRAQVKAMAGSAGSTAVAPLAPSLSATEAARKAGVSDRAIRAACANDKLAASKSKRGPRLNGFHVTRHTFASACLSAGLNPAKVAALLGDTLEVTLSTYAHFLPDDDDRAREILGSFFRPADRPGARIVPGEAR
jgi:integrase